MKRLVLDPNALASGIVDPHSDRPPRLLFEALENLAFEAIVTGDKDLLDHTEQLDPRAIGLREACELLELID